MAEEQQAFERSRQHRRGVQRACVDLEDSLARAAGRDPQRWSGDVASRLEDLGVAFQHHKTQSEGPDGLLQEIVEVAPRLANAVEGVKHEHQHLLVEISRLKEVAMNEQGSRNIQGLRDDVMALLQGIAAHRHAGADLIYEAYSVDVEGGDSG